MWKTKTHNDDDDDDEMKVGLGAMDAVVWNRTGVIVEVCYALTRRVGRPDDELAWSKVGSWANDVSGIRLGNLGCHGIVTRGSQMISRNGGRSDPLYTTYHKNIARRPTRNPAQSEFRGNKHVPTSPGDRDRYAQCPRHRGAPSSRADPRLAGEGVMRCDTSRVQLIRCRMGVTIEMQM